jgi:imidazolonepropionase-like amidohydrolase
VPTMMAYYYWWEAADTPLAKRDRKRVELHGPSFTRAYKAGVKIAFGTDAGYIPWSDAIAKEFSYLVEYGMTPMEAIKTATSNAAELLDAQGELGVISPGAYADLMAVEGDPLKDIRLMEKVMFVMKDGKVHRNENAASQEPAHR